MNERENELKQLIKDWREFVRSTALSTVVDKDKGGKLWNWNDEWIEQHLKLENKTRTLLNENTVDCEITLKHLFANHVNRESYPVISYERFMEMLAERGLKIHPFTPPRGNLCLSISKDSRLVEQYSTAIFPCYFTEKQMEEELDKLSHPDYSWSIHGIKNTSQQKQAGEA